MDDAGLISSWTTGLAVAAFLVAAAAALLIGIWLAARRILRLAAATLQVVEDIKANTRSIWALKRTSDVAEELAQTAESIRNHGGDIAETLSESEDSGRSDVA